MLAPAPFGDGAAVYPVAGGEINFYQEVPLYEEEMSYKVEKGLEALPDRMNDSMLSVGCFKAKRLLERFVVK